MFSGDTNCRHVLLRALQETGVLDDLEISLRILPLIALSHQVCPRFSWRLTAYNFRFVCIVCIRFAFAPHADFYLAGS